MVDKKSELDRLGEPLTPLPSENDPAAVELHRETTETVVQRRIREVVRYEPATRSIPIERLRDPVLAQALLDERDYWREQCAEREESQTALLQQSTALKDKYHQLDKRCALAEDSLENANRTNWLEGVFFAVGGAFFGAGISPQVAWPQLLTGMLLMAVAIVSGMYRWRRSARKGAQ